MEALVEAEAEVVLLQEELEILLQLVHHKETMVHQDLDLDLII
jgi:hypothetical protein